MYCQDHSPQRQNAAIPQPKNRNISRKGAKRAKGEYCHFDRREKSFSDPSHPLGMTDLALSLGVPFDCAQGMLGVLSTSLKTGLARANPYFG
jgi:hypothetical protein